MTDGRLGSGFGFDNADLSVALDNGIFDLILALKALTTRGGHDVLLLDAVMPHAVAIPLAIFKDEHRGAVDDAAEGGK
jgi:hypothetical protein